MISIEVLDYIITFVAIIGAFLVSNQKKQGFYCWLVSNSYLAVVNLIIQNWPMVILFTVYFLITVNGIIKWRD